MLLSPCLQTKSLETAHLNDCLLLLSHIRLLLLLPKIILKVCMSHNLHCTTESLCNSQCTWSILVHLVQDLKLCQFQTTSSVYIAEKVDLTVYHWVTELNHCPDKLLSHDYLPTVTRSNYGRVGFTTESHQMWYGSLILTSSRSASTGSSQGLRENRGCIKITHRHSSGLWTQMDMNGAASIWTQWPVTHCVSDCFSEKTRMQKSPFRCGSKVDGTIRYSPGGSLKRVLTSRRLMKVSDFAVWACVRKKFLSRCTSRCPWNWKVKVKGKELFWRKYKRCDPGYNLQNPN